jgi:hypothetical protein
MKKLPLIFLGLICFSRIALAAPSFTPDRFILYPTDPNVTDPQTLLFQLKPGDTATETLNLKNLTPATKTFTIYATDRLAGTNGVYQFPDLNQPRKMSQWITVDPAQIPVDSNQQKTITVHISIPNDAPLGEYFGAIAAVKTEPSTTMPNINIAVRYLLGVDLKITDNPQHIVKQSEHMAAAVEEQPSKVPLIYGGLVLCGGGIIWGLYLLFKRKNKKSEKSRPESSKPKKRRVGRKG